MIGDSSNPPDEMSEATQISGFPSFDAHNLINESQLIQNEYIKLQQSLDELYHLGDLEVRIQITYCIISF